MKYNLFVELLGWLSSKFVAAYAMYDNKRTLKCMGGVGKHRRVGYPFKIRGAENVVLEDYVNIGSGCTIYTTRAKLIVKSHVIVGPNLTIITGDHKYEVGSFIDATRKPEANYDQDVIIENDVWIGSNVTILKGVHIGRGAIVAAGAVVTKDIPPYSIAAGVPAKPIRLKWTLEEIKEHEAILYAEHDRIDVNSIEIK